MHTKIRKPFSDNPSFVFIRVFAVQNFLSAMIAPPKPDLVTVNIDGKEIAVPKGTNVIEAARLVGVDVPHYCYHPKLTVVGNCRMCLIEMGMPAVDPATKAPIMDPATGKQKINWIPRPQIGCATNASPGLHIRTQHAAGEGLPRGRDGVSAHQPPAGLPDLRPGRRVQAAGTGHRLRPRLLALHRAEEREAEAHAARAARHARRRALHPLLALRPLLARRSRRTTSSASSTAAATRR